MRERNARASSSDIPPPKRRAGVVRCVMQAAWSFSASHATESGTRKFNFPPKLGVVFVIVVLVVGRGIEPLPLLELDDDGLHVARFDAEATRFFVVAEVACGAELHGNLFGR